MKYESVTLGIDEAGRGPVLGPLVMAGVCVRTRAAASLTRAGVTDSKAYGTGDEAHEKRSALVVKIRAVAESIVVRVIDVHEIDQRVQLHELNVLEREHASVIIRSSAPAKRIVADGARMFRALQTFFPQLEARDRGESCHVAVAAASIIAKVRRDELFHCIRRRYEPEFGPIGGGFCLGAEDRAAGAVHRVDVPESQRGIGHERPGFGRQQITGQRGLLRDGVGTRGRDPELPKRVQCRSEPAQIGTLEPRVPAHR